MTLSKLLIADDEPSVLRLLEVGLQSDDVVIRTATSGREALAVAAEWKPDVLLVDVLLPDVDGFAVCRRIREHSTVPIILMSELRHDQNLALCLDAGADDYVAKPFSVAALAVRIAAVLRRADLPLDGGTPREIACDRGRLTIDLERGVALRRGHVVPLGNTQYRLLAYLADNAGRTVPYDEIVERVWGPDHGEDAAAVLRHVGILRRRLDDNPERPRLIGVVEDVGLRFTPR